MKGAVMPGPFFHIYSARRTADYLCAHSRFTFELLNDATRLADPARAHYYGQVMQRYPAFASLGAIGPDLFFFLGDVRAVNGDDLMRAIRIVYTLDNWKDNDWQ